jgi:hypothetical protein
VIRLASGLAAATLLLLAFASATFAAEPIVTVDASGGTSNDGAADAKAVANVGSSSATVTLGASAPMTTGGGADGSATVTLGAGAPTAGDGADGSAAVSLGAGAPATADAADGSATVTLGAPATAGGAFGSALVTIGAGDGADGAATVRLGAGAPTTGGEPTPSVDSLSSGLASLMAFGGGAAEDTTGAAPAVPATDGASQGLSPTLGLLSFGAPDGAPGASGGSGGSGNAVAASGDAGNGALPETSAEALASGLGIGFPMLALLLGLLAGGLVARRRSEVR